MHSNCAALRQRHDEMAEFIKQLANHLTKCARRDTNVEHYPAEWQPIRRKLNDLLVKLP